MEKGEITTMNSYALDPSIEEFNKEDLKEAGVVIDYDQLNSFDEIKVKKSKKPNNKNHKYLRWIFLVFLFFALFIIMYIGHQLIDSRQTLLDDQKPVVLLNQNVGLFQFNHQKQIYNH